MIVQPELYVPPALALGIASGKYVLIGGTVRHAGSGRIVALLKDAPGLEKGRAATGRAAAKLSASRVPVVAAALGAVTVGGAYVLAHRHRASRQMPECVSALDASLSAYLEAGRAANLHVDIVGRLIRDLDAVTAFAQATDVAIDFSTGLWANMVTLVVDHTSKLAVAYGLNEPDLAGRIERPPGDDSIMNLRRHLQVQGALLNLAA